MFIPTGMHCGCSVIGNKIITHVTISIAVIRFGRDFHSMKNTNSVTIIRARLQNCGDALAAERHELEAAIRASIASGGQLTNKTIIIDVIHKHEREHDAQRQAVVRNGLEMVAKHTPDDAGGQAA